jgi:hypothetical protein
MMAPQGSQEQAVGRRLRERHVETFGEDQFYSTMNPSRNRSISLKTNPRPYFYSTIISGGKQLLVAQALLPVVRRAIVLDKQSQSRKDPSTKVASPACKSSQITRRTMPSKFRSNSLKTIKSRINEVTHFFDLALAAIQLRNRRNRRIIARQICRGLFLIQLEMGKRNGE